MLEEPLIPGILVEKHIDLGISHAEIVDVWQNGEAYITPEGTRAVRKIVNDVQVNLSYIRQWEGEYVLKDIWIDDNKDQ